MTGRLGQRRAKRGVKHMVFAHKSVVDTNDALTDVIHFDGLQPTYAPRSQLLVTLLIPADEFCFSQHMAMHCSLDLAISSRFLNRA